LALLSGRLSSKKEFEKIPKCASQASFGLGRSPSLIAPFLFRRDTSEHSSSSGSSAHGLRRCRSFFSDGLASISGEASDAKPSITAQNLILPSGTEKIGRFEYLVGLNSSPDTIEKLNAIPIKSLPNGTTVYIRDVANILNLPGNSNF
jgi:hypothetical protein